MIPLYWQVDSVEATRTRQILVPGREGTVNFDFSQDGSGAINLEPARVMLMVPMKDTDVGEQMGSMLQGSGLGQLLGMNMGGSEGKQLSSMMQQATGSMNVPIMLSFGSIDGMSSRGVSGNTVSASVLKNSIRQLGPGVLEQQIVTREVERNNRTAQVRQEYDETVIRFTSQTSQDLYVIAATVNYTVDHKFERKLVLYGTVRKGQVMPDPSNSLGSLTNIMQANPQLKQLNSGQIPLMDLLRR